MTIRFRNHNGQNISALILLMLGFSSAGAGQATPAEESAPEAEITPEEIVVYGEKSVIVLRNELYRAEERFFTMFNSLNSNDDLDVKCEKITFVGERRRYNICRPQFALKREAEMSQDAITTHSTLDTSRLSGTEHAAYVRKNSRQMWAEMADLVKEHPELQKELADLQKANQALSADRQKK
jgi:hypothetical protein